MLNLKDSKSSESVIRILLFGASGAGKTTLAATFPEPIALLDFDHKLKPMFGRDVDCESFDMKETPDEMEKEYLRYRRAARDMRRNSKYKTLVLDSLSTFDMFSLKYFMKAKEIPDMDVWNRLRQHYNTEMSEMNAQQIGKNIILIAHEEYIVDEDSKIHKVQPMVSTKIRDSLPALFEESWYMQPARTVAGATVYRLYFRSSPNKAVVNTTFLHNKEGYIDDPTYAKIMQNRKVT